ncbi:NAD-binding protein [Clostridium sp. MSJ-4]|uniref:NAD-binding protein n=1 Tax=Clostridium simiarum TaxID=2841506 RepID=A0ABS6F4B2_9CLOT|nr:NAD-binding protein [Clostridium simiarum]MBU5592387.1 NAD-binding protein [Clostridium simiarum]
MYIIIVGCGRMGSNLAKELANEGHNVVVIDKDSSKLENLGVVFNGTRIRGIEIDKDVLVDAGINEADVFVAMTSNDNVNLMSCQIAKNIFGVKKVISRVYDREKEYIYRQMSIDYVCPVMLNANVVRNKINLGNSRDIVNLDNDIVVTDIPVYDRHLIKVRDLEEEYNCVVSSILRNSEFKIVKGNEIIQKGDKIVCTISVKDKDRLISELLKERVI